MEDKPKVVIKWVDAKFCSGMHTEEDILEHKMNEFESLGYLISKTGLTTIIASERNDDGEYRDITLIPTGSIQSVQSLVSSSAV